MMLVDVPWTSVLGKFESNYTNNWLRVFAHQSHNVGNLVLGEHRQNLGGIGVRSLS